MSETTKPKTTLKRDVGLALLTLYGLGNIVGAGIYVLVGEVAGVAGLQAPFAFLLAAFVAGASGLSYGELSARYPTAGWRSGISLQGLQYTSALDIRRATHRDSGTCLCGNDGARVCWLF